MSCAEMGDRLHAYLDDDLDADQGLAFEEHLRSCPECTRELEMQQALRAGLREGDFRFTAPAGLKERIRSALRPVAPAAAPRPWISPALTAAAALLIGVAIGVVGTYYGAPRPSAASDLPRGLMDAHVRSLLADHLIDVKSENKHVVKPWLAQRLDFSLPVANFEEQGFALEGGRLDFVDARTVAALVYSHGNHHINLFIWPAGEAGDASVQETSQRGYTLLHWRQGGLNFWAASDVNIDDLRTFVQLVQAQGT